jgi:hypothetical protein
MRGVVLGRLMRGVWGKKLRQILLRGGNDVIRVSNHYYLQDNLAKKLGIEKYRP